MNKSLLLKHLYSKYKNWVIKNPNVVTDMEIVATWSSYFVAGKINKSPIVSELVYCLSKLLSLINDRIIREAYGNETQSYTLQEQIKLWLTIIHYCEVFVELAVKSKWGGRGKWTTVTFLQMFKFSLASILLYRYRIMPIQHPPIPVLQRNNFTEEKDKNDNLNNSFTLKRSGRIVRCVDGAPPVSLRDWQPIKIIDNKLHNNIQINSLVYAETLHLMKPLIHLLAMRRFSTKSWKQWIIPLCLDLASLKIYNKHINELSGLEKLEISRRKLGLILYILRSPMYDSYSNMVIENVLKSASSKIPLMEFICTPIIQYLGHWQEIYFYMWAS